MFYLNRLLKFYLFSLFLVKATEELYAVVQMLRFQRKLKLQELDVYKTQFHREERRAKNILTKSVWAFTVIYFLLVGGYIVIRMLFLGKR